MHSIQFDPQKNTVTGKHHRHSIRLQGYDYSQSGAYFVTICTHERACLFGVITDGEMHLNETGKIVWQIWQELPARYPQINLGPAVVMPNHFHGVIEIVHTVGSIHELTLQQTTSPDLNNQKQRRKMLLPKVIGYFKMNSAKRINELRNSSGAPVWQKNYYEYIIRDEADYYRIFDYIMNNPLKWLDDEEYSSK